MQYNVPYPNESSSQVCYMEIILRFIPINEILQLEPDFAKK